MVQVRFETGPGGAQSVEVRVTDSATEAGADTLLTSGDSSEVPGVIRAAKGLREISQCPLQPKDHNSAAFQFSTDLS